jgi:hypothetical protein
LLDDVRCPCSMPVWERVQWMPVASTAHQGLDRVAVGAPLAVLGAGGKLIIHKAIMGVIHRLLDPLIAPVIGDEEHRELKPAVERLAIPVAVDVDEVAAIRDGEAVAPQEPLVEFHLALVRLLPPVVERDRLLRASRLVVDDDELPVRRHPQIVDRPEEEEVGRRMVELHADEVLAPAIELRVGEGDGIEAVRSHERMGLTCGAVPIELLLQERIDGRIEGERWPLDPPDAEPAIEVEAAGAALEELELGAAEFEGFLRRGVEAISRAEGGHAESIPVVSENSTLRREGTRSRAEGDSCADASQVRQALKLIC